MTLSASDLPAATFRAIAAASVRYWEPRRIVYNAALAAIVVGYGVALAPAWSVVLSADFLLTLFILAVIANVCYCAAYPADAILQLATSARVQRIARPVVFTIGTLFAGALARFTVMGVMR